MEKSVDWQFDSYMQEIFQMKEVDIREYSPLALALLLYGAMSAFMTAFVPYIFVSATFMNSPPDDFSSDICNINRKMCTTCGSNLKKTL